MDNKTLENRLHLFEDVASDNHDTIYEVVSAFSALCRLLSQKEILTSDEFNSIVNKRRYHPPTETKPVTHAHWKDNYVFIKNDHTNIECSNCLCDIDVKSDDTEIYRYCPWCGAKMDEEVK